MTSQKSISLAPLQAMIEKGEIPGINNVEEFLSKYSNYKGQTRNWNRAENLGAPMGEDEMGLLRDMLDTNMSLMKIDEKYGLKPGSCSSKAARAALKFIYQNKKKCGFE